MISWLMFVAWLTGVVWAGQQPASKDTTRVGQYPTITLYNVSDDSVAFYVMGPRVDNAIRFLGILAPGDTTAYRSPYSGQVVVLGFPLHELGGRWFPTVADGP